ncbi:glycosyltransferase family 2 protein [Agrilactobacillus fermenti]|uniref:glycosyltransferase family 2 protein n=1 Tax=Agrilactobacillus fermenti TaxID=2586909 RepID=UPI003A5C3991
MNPKISVIVIIYNMEAYLKKCVESIICQTYTNLEILLIDDGSNDNSLAIIREYQEKDSRIKVVTKENEGRAKTRNLGVATASGEYIAFIDADDYVTVDYVQYLVGLTQNGKYDIGACPDRIVYKKRTIDVSRDWNEEILSSKKFFDKMFKNELLNIDISAHSKLIRTALFKKYSYPAQVEFEDEYVTHKLILAANAIVVGFTAKYIYLKRDDSIVRQPFSEKRLDLIVGEEKMVADVCHRFPGLIQGGNRRLAEIYINSLGHIALLNNFSKYSEIINELKNKLFRNGKILMKDSYFSKTNKLSLILLKLGFLPFRIVNNVYYKLFRT